MDTSMSRRVPSGSARRCASTLAASTLPTSFAASSSTSTRQVTTSTSSSPLVSPVPLENPVDESKRLISNSTKAGLTMRVLGGVAVCLQAPDGRPLLTRKIGDIDVTTRKDGKRGATEVLTNAGYVPDVHFNTFHGARRLLFYDEANNRKLDVFIGDFSMCHEIPISDRLELEPLTVPLAELSLTNTQIVELTERDQRDIYTLTYHHELSNGDSKGIEMDFIASLCAKDWGLWRTTKT